MILQEQLQAIVNKIDQISKDQNLSQAGREAALKKLAVDRANLKGSALQELGASWASLRSDYGKLQARDAELENRAGASWDYARLNYLAQTVKSKITQAEDASKLMELYNDAQNSSDFYIKRAWAEIAPQAAIERFGLNVDTGRLQNKAARDLEGVIYHAHADELQALKADKGKLVERAMNLQALTNTAESALINQSDINASKIYGSGTEFTRLMDGIRLKQTVDKDLITYTSLTIDAPKTEA